jgi:MFS family permease
MATSPLLAVLMLGHLGFTPWEYGLAFGAPCVGGLIGSRLARRLVARFGQHKVMLTAGALRACWSLGLAFIRPGAAGLMLVIVAELGLITCMGVFNPVFATYRLDQTPTDRVARTLSAWSVTSSATIAALTALWGLLASITSPRIAIAIAGLLILTTPLLLPRHDHTPLHERHLAGSLRRSWKQMKGTSDGSGGLEDSGRRGDHPLRPFLRAARHWLGAVVDRPGHLV